MIFKVTYYDYWNPRDRGSISIQAKTKAEATSKAREYLIPIVGTAVVIRVDNVINSIGG